MQNIRTSARDHNGRREKLSEEKLERKINYERLLTLGNRVVEGEVGGGRG